MRRNAAAGCLVIVAACGFNGGGSGSDIDAGSGSGGSGSGADAAMPDAAPFPDGNPAKKCIDRWKDSSIRFDPPAVIASYATTGIAERDPFLGPKGILYASRPPTAGADEDIYEAHPMANGSFGAATPVPALSVTGYGDEKMALAGNLVVIARTEQTGANTAGAGYGGGVDLFSAQVMVDPATGEITPTGGFDTADFDGINGPGGDHDPWLTMDGKHLYWAPGLSGAPQVIETASRASTMQAFANPVQLALAEDATTGLGDPWLTNDQKLILYSATVVGGHGQIRYALAGSGSTWSVPADVPDVNDAAHSDGDPILSDDACTIYFGSDRAGSWDLYAATVHDPPPPPP